MTSNTKLIISPSAHRDWRVILHYTRRRWGAAQEDAYDDVIWSACQRIQAFPEIGRQVSQDRPELREHILEHHTIVYRYQDHTVTILRIVNPRRRR